MSALSYLMITVCLLYQLPAVECTLQAQCKKPTIDNMDNMDRLSIDTDYYKRIDKEHYTEGEEVTVWCKSGYSPSSDTMRCDNPDTSQEWTPPTVTCAAQCKKPTIDNLDRLSIDKEYYTEGEEVTIQCIYEYNASFNTMRCDFPGTSQEWTPPTITCTAQCKKPTIDNLDSLSIDKEYYKRIDKEYYKKGEEVTVQCKSGYYPSSDTMRCDNPDTPQEWTPPTITCTALCKNPDRTRMKMDPDKTFYNIGDTVTVNCVVGYRSSSSSVRCVNRRTSIEWNPPPQCKAQCKKPIIDNMDILSIDKEYYKKGEEVTVWCESGYYPSSKTMRCDNPDTPQEWTPPTITCTGVTMTDWRVTSTNISARISCTPDCHQTWTLGVRCCLEPFDYDSCKWSYGKSVTFTDLRPFSVYKISATLYIDGKLYNVKRDVIRTLESGFTMTDWSVTSTNISARISCTPHCHQTWEFVARCCPEPYNDYRSCKWSYGKSVTFTDLQPFSVYKITATLNIGWGSYDEKSDVIRTLESVAEQPEIVTVPSMEDNTMRWRLSEKSGKITGLQMNISVWRDYNASFAVDESIQFPPEVTEYKIPLQYGTNYTITLRGFTSAGAGEVTVQNIETDIGDPLPPHVEKTSDGTLHFHPVLDVNGPVRSYEVIVFRGQEGNSTKECVKFKNTAYNSSRTPSHYTAAVLRAETLTAPRTFILGDNQHYNGFHNAPLIPRHNYTVYIRVTSRWNHVEKSSCALAGFLPEVHS